jgi:hypothetical protein
LNIVLCRHQMAAAHGTTFHQIEGSFFADIFKISEAL